MLPSVTRCIPHDFSMVDPEILEAAAARGSDVHEASASYAQGLFVPDALLFDDRRGYFESFRTWFDRYVKRVLYVEKEFQCDRFLFIGHVDLVCELVDGRLVVVDYKTPAVVCKGWRLQLAAYRYLVAEHFRRLKLLDDAKRLECMSLRLMKNGSAARGLDYTESQSDFVVFLSALNVHRFFNS